MSFQCFATDKRILQSTFLPRILQYTLGVDSDNSYVE